MPYVDPVKAREYRTTYGKQWREKKRAADPLFDVKNNRRQRAANPKTYMFWRAKSRAKELGIPFSITVDDVVVPEFCPVFPHLRLEFQDGRQRPDNTPTLDKIIPSLGYVPGNVQVISMRANRLKSDATVAELEAIIRYIKESQQ
jgi:hypothetical protein